MYLDTKNWFYEIDSLTQYRRKKVVFIIKEWNLLRTIACLSIVLLHSTTHVGRAVGYESFESIQVFRVMLTYATPTFIVLSEVILANRYQNTIPDNFFEKRVKFIFGPFITFALIDAFVSYYLAVGDYNVTQKIINNLKGNYEGYFILVIFQFYVLHYLIVKYRISVNKLLSFSLLIMAIHLYLLHSNIPFVVEYRSELKLPFTAWFGYFTLAYMIGKNYNKVKKYTKEYKWFMLVLVLFSAFFIYFSFEAGNTNIHSRRIDLLPFVFSTSLAVIGWGQILPNLKIINLVSNYSLGIYLLHWQVQRLIAPNIVELFPAIKYKIIGLFFISLLITIVIIKVVSMLPFGELLIGKTRRSFKSSAVTKSKVLYN